MHAWSIQNICTHLIYSEHLNLFQILSEIVSIKQSRWLVLDLTRVTPTRLKILLLVHRLEEERDPRKGTKWDLVSQKVEKCPKYRNASNVDVMGKAIRCAGAIVDLPNTVGSQNMQCFPSVKFKQGEGSTM